MTLITGKNTITMHAEIKLTQSTAMKDVIFPGANKPDRYPKGVARGDPGVPVSPLWKPFLRK